MKNLSLFLFLSTIGTSSLYGSNSPATVLNNPFFFGFYFMFFFLLIAFNFFIGVKTKNKLYFLFAGYLFFSCLLTFELNTSEKLDLFNMKSSSFFQYIILSFLTLGSFLYFLKELFKTEKKEIILSYTAPFLTFLGIGFSLSLFLNQFYGTYFSLMNYLLVYLWGLKISYVQSKKTKRAKIAKLCFTSLILLIPLSFFEVYGPFTFLLLHYPLLNIGIIEKTLKEYEYSRHVLMEDYKDQKKEIEGLNDCLNKLGEENKATIQKMKEKELELDFERATLEDFLNHSHQKKIERDNILAGLEQGYLTFNQDGIISEGATKKIEELLETSLFESEVEKLKIWDVLTKNINDEDVRIKSSENLKKWVGHLFGNKFQLKDVLQMAPKNFTSLRNKVVRLDFRPILDVKKQKKLIKVILIASDKTEQAALKRLQEQDHEEVVFIKYSLQNPVLLIDLIQDTYETLDKNQNILKEREVSFRQFHTLKARFMQFGLKTISDLLNLIEDNIHLGNEKSFTLNISLFRKKFDFLLKENDLLIQAVQKFLVQEGNAIEGYRMIEHIVNASSLEELHLKIYNEYILIDIRKKLKRYESLIKEVASQQDKKINFKISGDEVLVEYNKYSEFVNSLIHVFRNMVDHGIESQEERKDAKKSREALIEVNFENNTDHFLIIFKDDGRGMDLEKIRSVALKRKLKTKEEIDLLSETEIYNLIFAHGFSTRDSIDDISGRGVGMEAVLTEVINIGGTISASSKPNKETKFTVKLPL